MLQEKRVLLLACFFFSCGWFDEVGIWWYIWLQEVGVEHVRKGGWFLEQRAVGSVAAGSWVVRGMRTE